MKPLNELLIQFRKDPTSKSFAPLAESLRRNGRIREALEVVQEGLSYYPTSLSARVILGKILIQMKRYDEARFELESVTRASPDNYAARKALVEIYLVEKKTDLVLRNLKLLVYYHPQDQETSSLLQKIESEALKHDESRLEIKDEKKIRLVSPVSSSAKNFNLIDSESDQEKISNHSRLIYQYTEKLNKDPASRSFAPLAEAYRCLGQLDRAVDTARLGLDYHPHFTAGKVVLAHALFDQKKYPEVIQTLLPILKNSTDNLLALRLMAESYLRLSNEKEALSFLKLILYNQPSDQRVAKLVEQLESDVPLTKEMDFLVKFLHAIERYRGISVSL